MSDPLLKGNYYTRLSSGIYEVLSRMLIRLPIEKLIWVPEDIDSPNAVGSCFRGFELSTEVEACFVCIVDVTNDQSEPDVEKLEKEDVPDIDQYLHLELKKHVEVSGGVIEKWMGTNLNISGFHKGLTVAYITKEEEILYQKYMLRHVVNHRKLIYMLSFRVDRGGELFRPLLNSLMEIKMKPQREASVRHFQ
jgi:hypothetical protein